MIDPLRRSHFTVGKLNAAGAPSDIGLKADGRVDEDDYSGEFGRILSTNLATVE